MKKFIEILTTILAQHPTSRQIAAIPTESQNIATQNTFTITTQNTLISASPNWPPPYKLRYSTRAKHASISIHHPTGLEVVIPQHRKNFDISRLLSEKRTWIEKHWNKINDIHNIHESSLKNSSLPSYIFIPHDKQLWKIKYKEEENQKSKETQPQSTAIRLKLKVCYKSNLLIFSGNHTTLLVQDKLISWLKTYAKDKLKPKLDELSLKTGLNYNNLSIRSQSTIWGSCNSKKNISLNLKLLFLPTVLTNYVMLHELCHTKYLNHGRNFWNLVGKFDKNYNTLDKQLRQGNQYLPKWLLMGIVK